MGVRQPGPVTATFNSGLKGTGHGTLPPMLEQYVALRDQHPDDLLLFQIRETV